MEAEVQKRRGSSGYRIITLKAGGKFSFGVIQDVTKLRAIEY